jgi:ABC-type uncharacterized transport system fused permease/ATPase subunit
MVSGSQGYRGSEDYIASKPLMEIVNVAIALGKPLVIKGEPGTGKTLIALQGQLIKSSSSGTLNPPRKRKMASTYMIRSRG